MRLAFTSDIHIDSNGPGTLNALVAAIAAAKPDVTLIAGDIATGPTTLLETLLALKAVSPTLLVVAGNHDVWADPDAQAMGLHAWTKLDKLIPALCVEAGAHFLDAGPITIGNVGFAGNLGWYDLSLREHLLGAPMEAYRIGEWGGMRWNDHRFAFWPGEDGNALPCEVVAERLRGRFAAHLSSLRAPQIVVATHMLAFQSQVYSKPHPGWRFANAFMGSLALGDIIRANPRVVLAIAGHTHVPSDQRIGSLRAVVSPLGYKREWRADNVVDAARRALTVVEL